VDTPRVRDGVIPRRLDRYASEDNGKDGSDPKHNHDCPDDINQISEEPVWEDSNISCHNGEFGEGNGGRVREVAAIKGFGDPAYIVWEIEEVRAQVPDVLSEAEVQSYETGC
jgi:hypothetical protein